jgi:P-type Ca2+ transporter type 2C
VAARTGYVAKDKEVVGAAMEGNQTRAYQLTVDEALTALGSDVQHGLTGDEARARLEEKGKNEIGTEKPAPLWRTFLARFQNVLVILLLIARRSQRCCGWH